MKLVSAFIVAGIVLLNPVQHSTAIAGSPPVATVNQDVPTLAPMLKMVLPGVVGIAIEWSGGGPSEERNPLHGEVRRFYNVPSQPEDSVYPAASGVVIDARKGFIVTNNHIVEHAKKIVVTLADGRKLRGKLVGSDAQSDIALIRISAEGLTEIPFGGSNKIEVGDFVVAIGNPLGTERNITTGIVVARRRNMSTGSGPAEFIQTDAATDPANSGGALVDLRGKLVGINTMIATSGAKNAGVGFAIPARVVRDVTDQLAKYGQVLRQ